MNDKKPKVKQYKGRREVSAGSGSQRTDGTHQNTQNKNKKKNRIRRDFLIKKENKTTKAVFPASQRMETSLV